MTIQPIVLLKVARDGSVDTLTSAGVLVVVVNEASPSPIGMIPGAPVEPLPFDEASPRIISWFRRQARDALTAALTKGAE